MNFHINWKELLSALKSSMIVLQGFQIILLSQTNRSRVLACINLAIWLFIIGGEVYDELSK